MPTDYFLVHAACTWALVGLIWMVQLVQYPSFRVVGEAEWTRFHEFHCARIAWVVAPLMLMELMTGIALFYQPPPGIPREMLGFGLCLLAVIWLSTALLSVPLHASLKQHSFEAQRRLVWTNWIRTMAWTLRGLGALYVLRNGIVFGSGW